MAKIKRSGLGKGLDLLFADNASPEIGVSTLPIGEVEPNRSQPRRDFSAEELTELENSIREHGILSPLIVRPIGENRYQIVAGERRFRAAKGIGLTDLPVVIRELDDRQTMEIALVENIIRADLTPIEEAEGFRSLMEFHGLTQEEISKRIGRSRSAIANSLRLLTLPSEVIAMVSAGKISAGHARALIGLEEGQAITLAVQIIKRGLTVRQIEELVKQLGRTPKQRTIKAGEDTAIYKEIELSLGEYLGRKVKVVGSAGGKGKLTLSFQSKEELMEFAKVLGKMDSEF